VATKVSSINEEHDAPFIKISNSTQSGKFACEGVFLLCFLGQIVTWQFIPNLLD